MNTARALAAAVIGSVQAGLVPRHAPAHVLKRQPFAGLAVRRSGVYEETRLEQRGGQAIPGRELRTEPRPPTATVSR